MSIRTKIGDLFALPLDAASWGVGVVAGKWKDELYLVLFTERFENFPKGQSIDPSTLMPVLAASSLDAKIWHGHWPILREGVDVARLAQPIYRVEEPAGLVAESFDRSWRHLVDAEVAKQLHYRKGVAPIRLENALKAYHGIGQWDTIFDELRYSNVIKSIDVVRHAIQGH